MYGCSEVHTYYKISKSAWLKKGRAASFSRKTSNLLVRYKPHRPYAGIVAYLEDGEAEVVRLGSVVVQLDEDVPIGSFIYLDKYGDLTAEDKEGRKFAGRATSSTDEDGFVRIELV
jgi:hypothetical protein